MASVVAVIPARYGSTRLPGKALLEIDGRPLVRCVAEGAVRSGLFDRVVVATDDRRIAEAVEGSGAEAMMTRADHPSGTDRIAEVAARIDADLLVNVQGDLPFVDRALVLPAVAPLLADASIPMGTIAVPIHERERWLDPNVVKVVTDEEGFALYFSRAPIPHPRDGAVAGEVLGWQHVGLYAFRRKFLLELASWTPSALESREKLEQLRVLERGRKIFVARIAPAGGSVVEVDTAADLEAARRVVRSSVNAGEKA